MVLWQLSCLDIRSMGLLSSLSKTLVWWLTWETDRACETVCCVCPLYLLYNTIVFLLQLINFISHHMYSVFCIISPLLTCTTSSFLYWVPSSWLSPRCLTGKISSVRTVTSISSLRWEKVLYHVLMFFTTAVISEHCATTTKNDFWIVHIFRP